MPSSSALRHFLDLDALDRATLRGLIDGARARKEARHGLPKGTTDPDSPLEGRVLALLFEKPSTRTRFSFDIGMRQLGGDVIVTNSTELQRGRGESISDTAQVLSRYVDAVMIRTSDHENLQDLAQAASVPIINGLTNKTHPCQIMADILTFEEHRGPIEDRTIAWIGDGNNVAVSWIHAAVKFGFELRLACPAGRSPDKALLDWARAAKGRIHLTEDPQAAVEGTACVVTDTWVSMGDTDREARMREFAPYQVTADLMAIAEKDAIFMHCLPAHRGEEVTTDVIDGPHSVIFDEAENRLHAQKEILVWSLAGWNKS